MHWVGRKGEVRQKRRLSIQILPLALELEQQLIKKYDPDNNGVSLIKV